MNDLKEQLVDSAKSKNKNTTRVVKTDTEAKNGQNKCPKCGATDISVNSKTGKLRCNFCRHEFEPEKLEGMETDLTKLSGQIIGSGAQNIIADTKDVLTFKCSSCGAEVVIDTSSSMTARCHWCRNTLSVNEQIPNGSVPDVVLPFSVTKDDAKTEIEKFVGKRKFFAHPKFRLEFTTNNIMGVYFPYMLVDVNAHASFSGEGEHELRSYTVGSDDNKETRYDAELYHIERDFDIVIDGLSIESSLDRLNVNSKDKTNNIINSIMPFDTENCVKYNANYLKGYTSEKRDTNIEQIRGIAYNQSKDIARYAANDSLKKYDRGVNWKNEAFNVKGEQWKAAYLPVWLYSYQQVKGDKKLLHYVAVNARTKETMGSIPIHMPKLLIVSAFVELLGYLAMIFVDWDYSFIFLLSGVIYFLIMYARYRNSNARHTYEVQTKKQVFNLKKVDNLIRVERGLRNSSMSGANNKRLDGQLSNNKINILNKVVDNQVFDTLTNNNPVADKIKDKINKQDNK